MEKCFEMLTMLEGEKLKTMLQMEFGDVHGIEWRFRCDCNDDNDDGRVFLGERQKFIDVHVIGEPYD